MYSPNPFPRHDIDPKLKNKDWCLRFCKAAWSENERNIPGRLFYRNSSKYDEIKLYALGRQPIYKYKKAMGVDEQTNTTWLNINFEVLPIIKKHRQIALGRLQKSDYNIVATPIDPLAKEQGDEYYADVKAKILLRQALAQQNSELVNSPALQAESGEPMDLEELEMQADYGFKHNMAIETELGIQLLFDWSNITACRARIFEDLFDFGVAAYKDYLDENQNAKFRVCDVRSIVTNNCRYPDFSDLLYCGECLTMTIGDIKKEAGDVFTNEDYEQISNAIKGQFDNPRTLIGSGEEVDRYKAKVLDLEWFSVNEYVYETRVNRLGNLVFGKADYNDRNKTKDKYKRKCFKMVYKAKWIVGTDFIYQHGVANDIKRSKENYSEAYLSYHLHATNFYEMTAKGIMEDLIPIADQVQIAWLKLQNIRNQLLPFLIELDLTALENVAFGKGGEVMSPKELLEMMFQTGILVTRRAELATGNVNYKSVEYVKTNYGEAIAKAWEDLMNNINLIREATGFNELTDGSTPNPKTLTTPAQMAYESTNNALYQIVFGEKQLLLSLARGLLCRLQRAVKEGNVKGYVRALGTGSMKFLQVSPDVSLHEFGITLEDKPDAEQRMRLQQHMVEGVAKGELDITDVIRIENTQNMKQAEQLLAYRIKKRREQMQQEALQMQQANAQTQVQASQAAEQAKQQTLAVEWQLRKDFMITEKALDKQIKEIELAVKYGMSVDQLESKERIAGGGTAPVNNGVAAPPQGIPPSQPEEAPEMTY